MEPLYSWDEFERIGGIWPVSAHSLPTSRSFCHAEQYRDRRSVQLPQGSRRLSFGRQERFIDCNKPNTMPPWIASLLPRWIDSHLNRLMTI
jgi:hypothetical protein